MLQSILCVRDRLLCPRRMQNYFACLNLYEWCVCIVHLDQGFFVFFVTCKCYFLRWYIVKYKLLYYIDCCIFNFSVACPYEVTLHYICEFTCVHFYIMGALINQVFINFFLKWVNKRNENLIIMTGLEEIHV